MDIDDQVRGTAIVAVTRNGVGLGLRLRDQLPGSSLFVPNRHRFAIALGAEGFDRLRQIFPELWNRHPAIVCIMATGIVVRLAAPLLRHKTADPAVVVVDEKGQFVISLLSGHLGGANRLAIEVAAHLGAQPVITTASDVQERPALDLIARKRGLLVENSRRLARLERAILEDEPIWVYDPEGWLARDLDDLANLVWIDPGANNAARDGGLSERIGRATDVATTKPDPIGWMSTGPRAETHAPGPPPGIWISEKKVPDDLNCLKLRPGNLVVGIGCNRGTEADEIVDLIRTVFERHGLSVLSIRNLASVDIKSDETGLVTAAKVLDRPIEFFSRQKIENVRVPNPSSKVLEHIGVSSVCEATALVSAQSPVLLVTKCKSKNATLAVAKVPYPS